MPQTVPNRPMNGAVLPMEASTTWPNCSWASTRCSASRRRRVSWDSIRPWASSVPAVGVTIAASTSGDSERSRSKAVSWARPRSSEVAAQNAGTARRMSVRTRCSSQPFQKISTQALTDISSSSTATPRMTASPCSQNCQVPFMRWGSGDAEHVVHVEQAGPAACEEPCRTQAALRVGGAAAALVGDLDAFAGAGEQHGVVTDDVAAAHGGETDGGRVAFAGDTFTAVDGAGLQVAAEGFGDDLAHLEG